MTDECHTSAPRQNGEWKVGMVDSAPKRGVVKDRENWHNVRPVSHLARPRPRPAPLLGVLSALALAVGCRTASPPVTRYDPAHDLGPLFQDVQLSGIFADSKTFVDAGPLLAPAEMADRYASARGLAGFSLQRFVEQNFELPRPVGEGFHADPARTMEDHIRALWPVLTRRPDTADARSSLIPLPQPYVVPGGRFREVYYWDSYFTMLGLVASGRTDLVRSMLDNFAYLIRAVRATAVSGWDFSSRWLRDPKDLRTLETTELLPVDLNCLLYHAERTIVALRRVRGRPGDRDVADRFARAAEARRQALLNASYEPGAGFFFDVRWRTGVRVTDRPTIAAAAPLYFGLATPDQGRKVAAQLERLFLKPGGFVPTLVASGQQWDAPNGWAPLEWLAIEGVRRYGRGDLAAVARDRWLALNRRTYRATGKMTEKYDVVNLERRAGGGEYPTQDGVGWAHGVALALLGQASSEKR